MDQIEIIMMVLIYAVIVAVVITAVVITRGDGPQDQLNHDAKLIEADADHRTWSP